MTRTDTFSWWGRDWRCVRPVQDIKGFIQHQTWIYLMVESFCDRVSAQKLLDPFKVTTDS